MPMEVPHEKGRKEKKKRWFGFLGFMTYQPL